MKANHSRALHVWPRDGNEIPGPPKKFTVAHSTIRLTDDQEAMVMALSAEFGISCSEVFRRGLELLYEEIYHTKGMNRNRFVDPCCPK